MSITERKLTELKYCFLQKWEKRIRPILFAMVPFIGFGGMSIHFLTVGSAQSLQQLGGLIMIWAIINLSLSRDRYSSTKDDWERERFNKFQSLWFERDRLNEERLNYTFDLHASQIAQINHTIGQDNPFVENDEASILEFCEDIERRRKESNVEHDWQKINSAINEFETSYGDARKVIDIWSRWIWKIEVTLLVWGTAQSTYGQSFYNWFHHIATK